MQKQLAFNEEMKEDRKHIRTRLEELRAQKFEMLKKRNEDLIKENWKNIPKTQASTAPALQGESENRVHDFGFTRPTEQLSHQKWGNLSLTSNAFFCDKMLRSPKEQQLSGATTTSASTKNMMGQTFSRNQSIFRTTRNSLPPMKTEARLELEQKQMIE